jgi:hypothetical protein
MDRFLHLRYYFIPLPDPNFQFTKITLAIGLVLVLAGVIAGFYRKKYMKDQVARKLLKKYPYRLTIYGLVILSLLACRELGIPYLSMRLWWFVLLFVFLYQFLWLACNYKKEYRKRQTRISKNAGTQKYLPKKKH